MEIGCENLEGYELRALCQIPAKSSSPARITKQMLPDYGFSGAKKKPKIKPNRLSFMANECQRCEKYLQKYN